MMVLLLAAAPALGQSPVAQERRLMALHQQLVEAGRAVRDTRAASAAFEKQFRQVIAADWSFTYAFTRLRKDLGVHVATSPDGRLRIYSWDDESGGSMRYFSNFFQYRDASGKVRIQEFPRDPEDAGYSYSALFLLNGGKEPTYLARRHAIYSGKDCYEGVQGFRLTASGVDPGAKVIRTATGLRNGIGFDYDFFSVVDRPERPITLITWDARTSTLALPVVTAKGIVTSRKIVYRMRGNELHRETN